MDSILVNQFVTQKYLEQCIDHPIDNVLFGLPIYTHLKGELMDVAGNTISVNGYVAIEGIVYNQNANFKELGYGDWSWRPHIEWALFTPYSCRPDLAGQKFIPLVGKSVDLEDKLYSLNEVKNHCETLNILFHSPREKSKGHETKDYYPTELQLVIYAYYEFWHGKDKNLRIPNSTVINWLEEEYDRMRTPSSHREILSHRAGLPDMGKEAKVSIARIIKPDLVKRKVIINQEQ